MTFTVRAGRSARVGVRLSPRGLAQLRRRHRLRVVLVVDLRRGGKVVAHQRRTVTFTVRRRGARH